MSRPGPIVLAAVAALTIGVSRGEAPAFWSALTGGSAAAARSAKPAFASGIAKIWLDGRVKADLPDSTAQIGAQQVWSEGDTGKGAEVAVVT